MSGNEIGTILLHIPSELRGLLGADWEENLDPANLQRYDLKQLRETCYGLVLEIQSELAKRNSPGRQTGQDDTDMGGMAGT